MGRGLFDLTGRVALVTGSSRGLDLLDAAGKPHHSREAGRPLTGTWMRLKVTSGPPGRPAELGFGTGSRRTLISTHFRDATVCWLTAAEGV